MTTSITFDFQSPQDVYLRINHELVRIIQGLSAKSDNEELSQAQAQAHGVLTQRQAELQKQLIELERNAEWNTFTIAFYGETGAGKSTLIETLRIILQEPTKVATQKAFLALRDSYNKLNAELQIQQKDITQKEVLLSDLMLQIADIRQEYERLQKEGQAELAQEEVRFSVQTQQLETELQRCEHEHNKAFSELVRLQEEWSEHKRVTSFWQKLLGLFKREPENTELELAHANWKKKTEASEVAAIRLTSQREQESSQIKRLKQQLTAASAEYEQTSKQRLAQKKEVEQEQAVLLRQQQESGHQVASLLCEMKEYADGEIIGDGLSDFTRRTQRYNFSLDGQYFALLDVPGIEGKEGLVLEEIERAVQTAHAVFYITNQAAPPQTGDEQNKGTLGKIREHLGAQTEVWGIYNKKINNIKYGLLNRPLISKDEESSLVVLNETMREQLGEHYKDVFSLTARPAFLAVTDHFLPESKDEIDRTKTLVECGADKLLDISNMNAFLRLLDNQLLCGSKAKIKRANLNKVGEALDQVSAELKLEQIRFAELSKKIKADADSAMLQLGTSFKVLEKRLDTIGKKAVTRFLDQVRNKMYKVIDKNVGNTKLENQFEHIVESEQKALSEKLPLEFSKELEVFQRNVSDIFQRFQAQAQELSAIYAGLNKVKIDERFHFAFNIDNGVKVGSLLVTVVGGVLAVIGTGGWVLAVGLAGVALSFVKSIQGLFDSDYKKSQQRLFIEKGLSKAEEKLHGALKKILAQTLPEMKEKIKQIENAIKEPALQTTVLANVLSEASMRLDALSNQINEAGG